MPLEIVRNDITEMPVHAIVNAANAQLAQGGGVCGAIFRKAGAEDMRRALEPYGTISTGQAVITPGFDLKALYVIHAVGPIYHDGRHHEEQQLMQAYENSLQLARKHSLESIAFPLLSSGIYGYPKQEALQVAVRTIKAFLEQHDMMVYLVVFDKESYRLSEKLTEEVRSYIDEHLVTHLMRESVYRRLENELNAPTMGMDLTQDKTFRESLFEWLDKKQISDVAFYKAANMDRKLFSKLRSSEFYQPSRATAFACCIALRLSYRQSQKLLAKAGFAFSDALKSDLIIRYALEKGIYDIHEVNQLLFEFDQPLLGL